jgi:hypothetical protein
MLSRSIKIVFFIALALAAIRLAFVASTTEIGWGLIATQWQDAILNLTGKEYKSIGKREPVEQAEFWLNEVDRILGEHPDSASLHLGAAWILDSPDIGFMQYHVRQNEIGRHFPQLALDLDQEVIDEAKKSFGSNVQNAVLNLRSVPPNSFREISISGVCVPYYHLRQTERLRILS